MQKVKNANNKIEVSFDWKMLYFIYRKYVIHVNEIKVLFYSHIKCIYFILKN
jgi:hypothetical protein